MGDISELSGLIVSLCFIGSLTFLLLWIPPEMYSVGENKFVYVPDVFEETDITRFQNTAWFYLNETGGANWIVDGTYYELPFTLGGHVCRLYYKRAGESIHNVRLLHFYVDFIFPYSDSHQWYDKNGILRSTTGVWSGYFLYEDKIELYKQTDNNASSIWQSECDHFYYYAEFAYNNTLYNSFVDAWDNQALAVFFGCDFDQISSGYNAFALMGMLLFFQLPNTNFYINAILNIPVWLCIAYLVYIFILKTIGAIFAGG